MKVLTSQSWCLVLFDLAHVNGKKRRGIKVNGCVNNACGQSSYNELMRIYSGLFLKEEEIKELLERRDNSGFQAAPSSTGKRSLIGDGDSCCPTEIGYTLNYTMNNVYGEQRYIVHMPLAAPPRFQFIHEGSCVGSGNCYGLCVEEQLLVSLLVIDGAELCFDYFLVPGYCSCKNIAN